MISTLFGWFWLIANLAVLWFALTRKPNIVARSLVVVGALLGAAAGLSNALVMTVNGWRMPVEMYVDWSGAPVFISDPGDIGSFYCRAYIKYDPPSDPWKPNGIHVDVPKPAKTDYRPKIGDKKVFTPRLAFLDDRHPFVVCGKTTLFSKGDVMGALGALLLAPGLLMILLIFVWRKIRRK